MELPYMHSLPLGGFNYDNCLRNKALEQSKAGNQVKTMKTGTTICGMIFKVGFKKVLTFLAGRSSARC